MISEVYWCGVAHNEDQPSHLHILDTEICAVINVGYFIESQFVIEFQIRITLRYRVALIAQRYPDLKFDNKLTFDKITDVYHGAVAHNEDQPSHLHILATLTLPTIYAVYFIVVALSIKKKIRKTLRNRVASITQQYTD